MIAVTLAATAQAVAAVAAVITSVTTLVFVLHGNRKVQRVEAAVDTGNGKTIGKMMADAEPHHHQLLPPLGEEDGRT